MDRRRFLLTSLASVFAPPTALKAQQAGRLYRIGFLSATTVPDLVEALRRGLREVGWIEDQHFALEHRSAESKFETIPALASDLARRRVDVIVVSATAIHHLKGATGNVPVVSSSPTTRSVPATSPVSPGRAVA